jgi:hypothetical protein
LLGVAGDPVGLLALVVCIGSRVSMSAAATKLTALRTTIT